MQYILIPGLLSVKLRAQIDCNNLYWKERDIYKKLKLFCRFDDVCNSTIRMTEDREFFLKIFTEYGFSKPLGCNIFKEDFMTLTCQNLYNGCFSYLMNIFNEEDDCAKLNSNKSVCTKSDYIKLLFDGGTKNTYKFSECGTRAIKNIWLDLDPETSRVYGDVIKLLKKIGYSYGFSLGGIPNDFRKFVSNNKFATNAFRYLIESFYQ